MLEPLLSPGGGGRGLLRRRANGGHSEGWTVKIAGWPEFAPPAIFLRFLQGIKNLLVNPGFRGEELGMLTCWRSATLNL